MNAISPVFDESTVESEKVLALDQPEYAPLITLRIAKVGSGMHAVMSRWEFSAEEREAITNGANLVVSNLIQATDYFPPLNLQIVGSSEQPSLEFMR